MAAKQRVTPPSAFADDDDDQDVIAAPATAEVVQPQRAAPEKDEALLVVADMGSGIVYRCRPGSLPTGPRVLGNWTGMVDGKLVSVADGCPADGLPQKVVRALGDLVIG